MDGQPATDAQQISPHIQTGVQRTGGGGEPAFSPRNPFWRNAAFPLRFVEWLTSSGQTHWLLGETVSSRFSATVFIRSGLLRCFFNGGAIIIKGMCEGLHAPGVNMAHPPCELFRQVLARKMDVEERVGVCQAVLFALLEVTLITQNICTFEQDTLLKDRWLLEERVSHVIYCIHGDTNP